MKAIQPHPQSLFIAVALCVAGSFLSTQPCLAQESTVEVGSGSKSAQQVTESDEVTRRKQEFIATPPNLAYISRIRTELIRNIVYKTDIAGVKPAEVEVHTAADGTILQTRFIKLSGTREWDETVMQAIQKMERLPLDGSGRVPPVIIFHVSPTQLQ